MRLYAGVAGGEFTYVSASRSDLPQDRAQPPRNGVDCDGSSIQALIVGSSPYLNAKIR
jgi:hypothetical protein